MVTVFFYGSFMSSLVLRDSGLARQIRPLEVASLEGFDIAFSPSATLVPSTKGHSLRSHSRADPRRARSSIRARLAQRLQTQICRSEEKQSPRSGRSVLHRFPKPERSTEAGIRCPLDRYSDESWVPFVVHRTTAQGRAGAEKRRENGVKIASLD